MSLFRKISLDRLASPEQLDQLLLVAEPKAWLALFAVFIVVATAIVWAYEGTVPTVATGQGVIVRSGGVLNMVSHGAGTVLHLNVHQGDRVNANQVIATIAPPALVEKRNSMRAALGELVSTRQHALAIRRNVSKLQLEVVLRQRENAERQIKELQDEVAIARQQIGAEEQLLTITKEQVSVVKQKLIGINDQIAGLDAQVKDLDAEVLRLETQPNQEDVDMRERVSTMQRDLAGIEKELTVAENVVTPLPGQVLEMKVYPGSSVQAEQAIVSIQPDVEDLDLLAYLPSPQAEDTKIGMEVQVSPSTVKREEFGFMKGRVVYVSDYPATTAALMHNFENELLVSALTMSGPVTELHVVLDRDAYSPSGFKWSASMGPSKHISAGTICSVQVVTRRQRPITLVLPYIKEKLR
ncbi:MAG TPA: NHLP bacteriocin system secretion protein [Candidatus Eremiobacteraceae bacterium]|nr:NHLP bacteriocin system secretion protein [Candidatus Eremiobacteraceae bacterium]